MLKTKEYQNSFRVFIAIIEAMNKKGILNVVSQTDTMKMSLGDGGDALDFTYII